MCGLPLRIFLAAGWMALAAPEGEAEALYAVTHIDVAAPRARLPEVTKLVVDFAAESRQDPGAVRIELLQQDGHPNHFTIYEVWRSRKDFDTHLSAQHTRIFRQQIQPLLGSPFRERLHKLTR